MKKTSDCNTSTFKRMTIRDLCEKDLAVARSRLNLDMKYIAKIVPEVIDKFNTSMETFIGNSFLTEGSPANSCRITLPMTIPDGMIPPLFDKTIQKVEGFAIRSMIERQDDEILRASSEGSSKYNKEKESKNMAVRKEKETDVVTSKEETVQAPCNCRCGEERSLVEEAGIHSDLLECEGILPEIKSGCGIYKLIINCSKGTTINIHPSGGAVIVDSDCEE